MKQIVNVVNQNLFQMMELMKDEVELKQQKKKIKVKNKKKYDLFYKYEILIFFFHLLVKNNCYIYLQTFIVYLTKK